MGAHHLAALIQKIPGGVVLAGELLHKAGIVAVRHKADILTVVLLGVDKAVLLRDLSHLGLVQRTQRQTDMRQLLLRKVIQHIALILALVQALFQQPAAGGCVLFHPGIVAGDHILHAVLCSPVQQVAELHIFIAVDAGVGGAARLVDADKFFNDLCPEVGGEIQYLIRHIQRKGHLGGVLNIFLRAAGLVTGLSQRFVVGKPHGDAGAVVARLLHQAGRHRAIHAAAHGNEGAGTVCRVLSGHRFSFYGFNILKQ